MVKDFHWFSLRKNFPKIKKNGNFSLIWVKNFLFFGIGCKINNRKLSEISTTRFKYFFFSHQILSFFEYRKKFFLSTKTIQSNQTFKKKFSLKHLTLRNKRKMNKSCRFEMLQWTFTLEFSPRLPHDALNSSSQLILHD